MNSRRVFLRLGLGGASSLLLRAQAPAAGRPNLLLILADDLGYSDLGCNGGEIDTPNLDRLAGQGLRFSQFYNAARCCPSRAALLTGQYPHAVGMGFMVGKPRSDPPPGYQGQLNKRGVTIAETLRPAGYATMMAGKWHVGEPGPTDRGFEEFYGFLSGFESFWDPSLYVRLPKGRPQRSYARGEFYATDAITDHALEFVGGARRSKRPFFLYLAYNAPHFPLHAPKATIDKYVPRYEKGWDAIRENRFRRMRELGLVDKDWEFTPRSIIPPNRVVTEKTWANKPNPAWDSIPEDRRADLVRRMATYAAMVEILDRNIGRVIEDLRSNGELDNTLILFLSDNGACAEWDPWGFDVRTGPDNILHKGAYLDAMGQPGTFHSYGSGWANACNTPWRLYKHYGHEGGIAAPCIAHWPAGIRRKNAIETRPSHLIDVMPTFVELAGAKYPAESGGERIPPPAGASMVPALRGEKAGRGPLFWEHEGNRAARDGKWKLVALGADGPWELYDMEKDRTEMHNLASAHPDRVRAMAGQWEEWARRVNVLPWIWKPAYEFKGQ